MKYDIRRLKTWRRVGIACLVLVISGIVGWLFEFICGFFHSGMSTLSWQGGNFLPWINMYSIGAFIILFTSYRFRHSPLKVFLISALFTGLFELVSGFILDYFFHHRYWNYSNEFLNIHGYTCLLTMICFGIGGLLLMYIIIPFLVKMSKKTPKKMFLTISILLCSIILVDEFYNFLVTKIFDVPRAIDIYKHMKF